MSDLKEFLEINAYNPAMVKKQFNEKEINLMSRFISQKQLGLFFWGRGGKQFVLFNIGTKETINGLECCLEDAKYILEKPKDFFYLRLTQAQDFLDCLACLGEDKVKELLKELGKGD